MKPVYPDQRVTLMLSSSYEAKAFVTARAAFRHLVKGSVRGMDATGSPVSWTGHEDPRNKNLRPHEIYAWCNRNVDVADDTPCLRSSSAGDVIEWAVPTIIICCAHYGYRPRKNVVTSLRTIYNHYKKTCQYCYEVIPYSQATKDHCVPRSKGGPTCDSNLVLACKRCNNVKDSHFPYSDVYGNPVQARPIIPSVLQLPPGTDLREEWKPFLHLYDY